MRWWGWGSRQVASKRCHQLILQGVQAGVWVCGWGGPESLGEQLLPSTCVNHKTSSQIQTQQLPPNRAGVRWCCVARQGSNTVGPFCATVCQSVSLCSQFVRRFTIAHFRSSERSPHTNNMAAQGREQGGQDAALRAKRKTQHTQRQKCSSV